MQQQRPSTYIYIYRLIYISADTFVWKLSFHDISKTWKISGTDHGFIPLNQSLVSMLSLVFSIKIARRNINNPRYADDTTLMAESEELKSLLMKAKEESLKLNIQKTKIMAFCPITSWQIDGETVETVADFSFLGSKITADGDCSHKIKRHLLLGRKVMTNLDSILKSRDIILPTKVHLGVGQDWATSLSLFTFMHWRRWQPTPLFLPGESKGQQSLVGCHLWGHIESDRTEVT